MGPNNNNNNEENKSSITDKDKSEKENTNFTSLSALSWLPVAIPAGPEAKYYAFTVKSVCAHFEKKENFIRTKGCKQSLVHLRHIKKICDENNIQLIIVYAPDKSHVLMPLICENISGETLREFMALNEKRLPPADKIKDEVLNLLDMKEQVFKEFCQKESIGFISLTDSLRRKIALGEQLYFTYDDHWTPLGHELVASTINDFLSEHPELYSELKTGTGNPD